MPSEPPLDIAILGAVHASAESTEIISAMVERPRAEVEPALRELWQLGLIVPDSGESAYSADASLDDKWFVVTPEGRQRFDAVAERYWDE